MTKLEKLWAGLDYCLWDDEIKEMKTRAIIGCEKLNSISQINALAKEQAI